MFAYLLLLAAAAAAASDDFRLLVLHNNDMHAKFEQVTEAADRCAAADGTCVGGFARVAHEVRRHRQQTGDRHVLFLNAGDVFVGSDWYVVHKWKICADFLNLLKPDVISLGNHEFDEGTEGLIPFLDELEFPVVCANIDTDGLPALDAIKKSVVLNVNGTKVGVIGYLTQETSSISNSGSLNISDEISAINSESEKLDRQGVKIIIALGHSGFTIDEKIAREAPLVDVVIGGHSNTFLWNGEPEHRERPLGPYPMVVTQPSGKKVPVVQAYAFTLYLGRLNLTFDDNGDLKEYWGQPEFLGSEIPQDEDVLRLLDHYRPEVAALNAEVIGRSKVYLDGFCRLAECNFGNLVTDAMVYFSAHSNRDNETRWTNSSIALYNSGNIRNSINVTLTGGNVTKGELKAALPFPNVVAYADLDGATLLATLEHSVHDYNTNLYKAEFLQVSGLRVAYDLRRASGRRVVSVEARCADCVVPTYAPLQLNRTYTVMMTEYILNGGDGFVVIRDRATNVRLLDKPIYDLVEWYFSLRSPVFPEVQGRIRLGGEASRGSDASIRVVSVYVALVCAISWTL